MITKGRNTLQPTTSPWHHHFPLCITDPGAFFNSLCLFESPVNYLGCQQQPSPSEQSLEPVPCAWVSAADPAHPSLHLPASALSLSAWCYLRAGGDRSLQCVTRWHLKSVPTTLLSWSTWQVPRNLEVSEIVFLFEISRKGQITLCFVHRPDT